MSTGQRLFCLVLLALALGACDLIDPTCPAGHWRPRANEPCVPVPVSDSGPRVDAGSTDGGALDAGVDAAAEDAATDASLDASAQDAAPDDAALGDGGDGG